jgi:hypothetical protein
MAPESLFHPDLLLLLLAGRLMSASRFPFVVRTAAHLEDFAQLADSKLGFNLLDEPVEHLQLTRLKMAKAFFLYNSVL